MIEHPSQHIILVSGATGRQGGAVVRHLLTRGFRVRALTRRPDQAAARALADLGTELVRGDFEDLVSLARALGGAYGAYSVQDVAVAGVEREIAQGKAFAQAARDAGVKHFIYSSVGGADRNTGIAHFDSKWEIEQYIDSLGLAATIFRPVYFMNNWAGLKDAILGGKLPQPLKPQTVLQQIAVDDIGAFVAMAFMNPQDWTGRAIELAGDALTMTQTAEKFGDALSRPVEYVQVPWDAFQKQAGEEFTAMYRWFESDGYQADIEALCKMYPAMKNLKAFLREQDWISK